MRIDFGAPKNANKIEAFDENEEARARKSIGKLLKTTLEELHRLHVNASCRCSTRGARVKEARDALTSYRRRVRECYKTIDVEGYEAAREEQQDKKRKQWKKTDAFARFRQSPGIDRGDSKLLRTVREERAVCAICARICATIGVRPARLVVRVENRVLRRVRSAKVRRIGHPGWL